MTAEAVPEYDKRLPKMIALDLLRCSPTNPRREAKDLEELTESVRQHGVLQPILVRPFGTVGFEIVAGHRRFAAAKAADLHEIPAIVRAMDDKAALELQVIENLERSDLHPLEEARGYERLITVHKYDVVRIAAKIGRSVPYVYDRVKLLKLIKPLAMLFLEEKITAGHAIILARLKPADQKRLLDPRCTGLFVEESYLWNPDDPDGEGKGRYDGMKARSVKELQAWVDENVRFDAKKVDPMLFPATAAAIERAPKVIPITRSNYIPPEAREGRTYGPRAWERADGEHGSKTCEYSVVGFVAVGPGRGESFPVCVAKEKCKTHWSSWQRSRGKAKRIVTKDAQKHPMSDRWAAAQRKGREGRRPADCGGSHVEARSDGRSWVPAIRSAC